MLSDCNIDMCGKYAHHEAFKGYNCGWCTKMTGKMAIVSVLISDDVHKWRKTDIDEYMISLSSAKRYLLDNGGRAAGLSIPVTLYYRSKINGVESRNEYQEAVKNALQNMNYTDLDEFRKKVLRDYPQLNSVAIVFVLNDEKRSFAHCINGHRNALSTRRAYTDSKEYAYIYYRCHKDIVNTICHELLHLYGAIDYYFPTIVKREAELLFPDSIMLFTYNNKNARIDDLTKYLIGWKTTLDSVSLQFLDGTLCTRRRLV